LPVKRTSIEGNTSTFLTALAAQERRVLELREELEKAEINLSRLKKQWALHEVIKEKNEFRRQQQLQLLKIVYRPSSETVKTPDDGRRSFNSLNHRLSIDSVVGRRLSGDSGETPTCLSSVRRTRRKVFAGSRHIKTLSLLSAVDASIVSAHRAPLEPANRAGHVDRISALSVDRSHVADMQRLSAFSSSTAGRNGQPKEVFIETGKQLVGDIREGLWTFFEDLRQATVGEEAIVNADHRSKAQPPNRCIVRAIASREEAVAYSPRRQARIESKQPCGTSDEKLAPLLSREQETGTGSSHVLKSTVPRDSPRQQCEDEDWDAWGTPMAKSSISYRELGSVTSDLFASSTTDPSSLRSSMSSSDATSPSVQCGLAEQQEDIPWPAFVDLSPGNLQMTASNLMSKWERSPAQTATPTPIRNVGSASLKKANKAD
ncbi:MAG: hypothetical protein Q9207_000887, partial [Kuettlingeria erythrocarpa]